MKNNLIKFLVTETTIFSCKKCVLLHSNGDYLVQAVSMHKYNYAQGAHPVPPPSKK
jgi:hypothetical protein